MTRMAWMAGLLLGCGSEVGVNGRDGGGTNWWDLGTDEVVSDGNGGGDDDFDDEEDEGFEGPEQFVWGELRMGPDGPTGGEIGLFVADESGVTCDWFAVVSGTTAPPEPCAECTWAGTLQVEEVERETDDPSCAGFAGDLTALDVGYSSNEAYWRPEGTWLPQGASEVEATTWFFEFFLGE